MSLHKLLVNPGGETTLNMKQYMTPLQDWAFSNNDHGADNVGQDGSRLCIFAVCYVLEYAVAVPTSMTMSLSTIQQPIPVTPNSGNEKLSMMHSAVSDITTGCICTGGNQ